ncbi:hypothetical protein PTTG_04677 [Puccinia triticina 1-1 BBBD Race 1]|uniref:Uncharacterized protein n=1 Tax=Puccinia triticina (isolate 1-1 / race 1 (BBBD)) TaxID=630390 RepID=A0A180G7Y3_PUCT1|nr:hypothetical protein PTTG_04677 [Puccinia triticina 1-1 BBBD Race 1]
MSDNSSPLERSSHRMPFPNATTTASTLFIQFSPTPNVLPPQNDAATLIDNAIPPPYNTLPDPGPEPPNFVPRPIPGIIDLNHRPNTNPHFTTPIIPIIPPTPNVSDLLSGLRVNDGLDRDNTILSHAQSIANLQRPTYSAYLNWQGSLA